jgi:hypothetical protein
VIVRPRFVPMEIFVVQTRRAVSRELVALLMTMVPDWDTVSVP